MIITIWLRRIQSGGYFPTEIPYRIVSAIEKNGGNVMMNAAVTQILTEGRQVTGVRVDRNGSSVDVHAPTVISDAGEYLHHLFS